MVASKTEAVPEASAQDLKKLFVDYAILVEADFTRLVNFCYKAGEILEASVSGTRSLAPAEDKSPMLRCKLPLVLNAKKQLTLQAVSCLNTQKTLSLSPGTGLTLETEGLALNVQKAVTKTNTLSPCLNIDADGGLELKVKAPLVYTTTDQVSAISVSTDKVLANLTVQASEGLTVTDKGLALKVNTTVFSVTAAGLGINPDLIL